MENVYSRNLGISPLFLLTPNKLLGGRVMVMLLTFLSDFISFEMTAVLFILYRSRSFLAAAHNELHVALAAERQTSNCTDFWGTVFIHN